MPQCNMQNNCQISSQDVQSYRLSVGASSIGRCQAWKLGDISSCRFGHAQSSVLIQWCVRSKGVTTDRASTSCQHRSWSVSFGEGGLSLLHRTHKSAFSAKQTLLALQVLFLIACLCSLCFRHCWCFMTAGWGIGQMCNMSTISVQNMFWWACLTKRPPVAIIRMA